MFLAEESATIAIRALATPDVIACAIAMITLLGPIAKTALGLVPKLLALRQEDLTTSWTRVGHLYHLP